MKKRILCLGAGGSTKVIIDILNEKDDNDIIGILDDDLNKQNKIYYNHKIIGTINDILSFKPDFDEALICVGATRDTQNRDKIFNYLKKKKVKIGAVISKNTIISPSVKMGVGVIIMPGVIVNAHSTIGDNVFINTGSIVEHDCTIRKSSFLSPGVVLSGCVTIGENSFIGSNSVLSGHIKTGDYVTVGAGSVVVRDIPNSTIAYGNPSHKKNLKRN